MKLLHGLVGIVALLTASLTLAEGTATKFYNDVTDPIFNSRVPMAATPVPSSPRITTLDVMGIGLSIEMIRQHKVWEALQKNLKESILPSDLSTYETNFTAKELASEKRAADTLEYGASHFVEHWPIPSVSIWPFCYNEEKADKRNTGKTNYEFYYERINDLRMPAGMHTHEIAGLGSYFLNEPENVLEKVFRFFEASPDVPALLLFVSDGDQTRGSVGDKSRASYVDTGPRRFDSMTESFVALLVARRERVDALRPFVWHSHADSGAQFKEQRDAHLNAVQKSGQQAFKPSKFLPYPWSDEQISEFDHLPTIAVLHRPVSVTYRKDKDGKPTFDPKQKTSLMSSQQKQAAFQEAFHTALQTIPGGKPARIFYDAGGAATGANVIPLSLAVHHSLPDLDFSNPEQLFDLSARMGNTGAASPFVQWAVGAMSDFDKKDASVTVNLRQSDEATITVITPAADKRVHPMGNPVNFNLAPQDGGPAIPVAPPTSSNSSSPTSPVIKPVPVAQVKEPVRHASLGTRLQSGDTCTQNGIWQCNPPDARAGDKHYLTAGRLLPQVRREIKLSAWQKMRGDTEYENVSATYTLISYDMPKS